MVCLTLQGTSNRPIKYLEKYSNRDLAFPSHKGNLGLKIHFSGDNQEWCRTLPNLVMQAMLVQMTFTLILAE